MLENSNIRYCPQCKRRVFPLENGCCPGCQTGIELAESGVSDPDSIVQKTSSVKSWSDPSEKAISGSVIGTEQISGTFNQFPLLTNVARFLRWFGWLTFCIGILSIIYGLIGLLVSSKYGGTTLASHEAAPAIWEWIIPMGVGFLAVCGGLVMVVFGELIGVFFAIELNTRIAAQRNR